MEEEVDVPSQQEETPPAVCPILDSSAELKKVVFPKPLPLLLVLWQFCKYAWNTCQKSCYHIYSWYAHSKPPPIQVIYSYFSVHSVFLHKFFPLYEIRLWVAALCHMSPNKPWPWTHKTLTEPYIHWDTLLHYDLILQLHSMWQSSFWCDVLILHLETWTFNWAGILLNLETAVESISKRGYLEMLPEFCID